MADKESIWLSNEEVRKLQGFGLQVAIIPQIVASVFTSEGGITDRCFGNDHLDRSMCLIKGQDGQIHFIAEPLLFLVKWINRTKLRWEPMDPDESWQLIERTCDSIGVIPHRPQQSLQIPYSLNLVQFFDGRILMTGGEPQIAALLRDIVGKNKVFETRIPIVHYPAWAQAGIHCLITEAPPIFKRLG
jgi:hypothetical protein